MQIFEHVSLKPVSLPADRSTTMKTKNKPAQIQGCKNGFIDRSKDVPREICPQSKNNFSLLTSRAKDYWIARDWGATCNLQYKGIRMSRCNH